MVKQVKELIDGVVSQADDKTKLDTALAAAEVANDRQADALRQSAASAAARATWISILTLVLGLAALLTLASWYPRYWEQAKAVQNLTRPPAPGQPALPGQVRDINSYTLAALVERAERLRSAVGSMRLRQAS